MSPKQAAIQDIKDSEPKVQLLLNKEKDIIDFLTKDGEVNDEEE